MIDDGTGLRERIKSELLAVYVHGEQGLKSPIGEIADRIAALSAVAPPPVLEGWVLVPREPTQAMVRGFWGEIQHGEMEEAAAKAAYAAMLAASPAAPAQPAMQAAPVAWQRMDSAPRDGTYILACDDDSHAVVYWMAGADAGWVYAWHEYDGPLLMHSAKFWQALPPPPTGE